MFLNQSKDRPKDPKGNFPLEFLLERRSFRRTFTEDLDAGVDGKGGSFFTHSKEIKTMV